MPHKTETIGMQAGTFQLVTEISLVSFFQTKLKNNSAMYTVRQKYVTQGSISWEKGPVNCEVAQCKISRKKGYTQNRTDEGTTIMILDC